MSRRSGDEQRVLEVMLIAVAVGLACLLYMTAGCKMVVLDLFYLPVVLSGFFLGRYRAGVLALFSVLAASTVTALELEGFAAFGSPLVIGLAVTVWGSVLSLIAMLVGTLSDERARQTQELHEAYVGVVEVLSRYLQGAHPELKARSIRIAQWSQLVAAEMKLSSKQMDDIRVAALMQDLGKIEITTRLITKAVDSLAGHPRQAAEYRFHGNELVHSLAAVLKGAIPILLAQDDPVQGRPGAPAPPLDVPTGARIIRAVRAFDALAQHPPDGRASGQDALEELRRDRSSAYGGDVLEALERVVQNDVCLEV